MNVTLLSGLCIKTVIDYSSTSVLLIYLRMFACIHVCIVCSCNQLRNCNCKNSVKRKMSIHHATDHRAVKQTKRPRTRFDGQIVFWYDMRPVLLLAANIILMLPDAAVSGTGWSFRSTSNRKNMSPNSAGPSPLQRPRIPVMTPWATPTNQTKNI